jgi:hypothetical protein
MFLVIIDLFLAQMLIFSFFFWQSRNNVGFIELSGYFLRVFT